MGEFGTPPDRGEIRPEAPEKSYTPNSLELAFAQLKSDYGSAEFLDEESVQKTNEVHAELDKLVAEAGISWDEPLEPHHISNIKNMVLGNYASDDPREVAEKIVEYLKKNQ